MSSYIPVLTVLATMLLALILLPLARAKTLALRAYRASQTADAVGRDEVAKRAALDAVTALAATLVLSTEAEVRDLKDPRKPGAWNPAVDGPRYLKRVVGDLWALGSESVAKLRLLHGLDIEGMTKLLEQVAEAQVAKLRATAALEGLAPRPPASSNALPGHASLGALGLAVILLGVGVSLAHCGPITEAALRATPGVPAPSACVAGAQRCNDAVPEVCSSTGRWWPALARSGSGEQRVCPAGCAVNPTGVAYCVAGAP